MQAGFREASFALPERSGDAWRSGFHRVPFGTRQTDALADERGRPDLAEAVATGWNTAPAA